MKILYAIQGTGNGHITRAKEIIPILQEKGDLDILVSGNENDLELGYEIKYKIHGLNYTFGKKGGIDFLASYKKMNLSRFFKEIKALPVKKYDLVLNDFEPVSAWAAKINNVNIVSLSHQNAVSDKAAPKYSKHFLEKLILKYYAPANSKFGFHFKTYSTTTFTPIIRKKIRNRKITNKGHFTVYLPSYNHNKIVKVLSQIPIVKWHIFSKETTSLIFRKNITIYPVNEFDFIKSMASSSGVLCGAGFETPSEALFLRKKLMVIPMKNQYEQKCNALALKEMGVPVLKKLSKKRITKIAKWIQADNLIDVDYEDTTEDLIEAILLPYYNETLLSTIVF
ncbi:glycosyl transferase [Polaribacter reichenbachii]|uniref:Glycosyl transferase n=1 Tax=Polaribacter reichenbachii TaxID=996801 RepID=A0A1B8TPQ1_9FLAO|nr:glycosyltransferase family protein [Polaribacter reichenbachii]APZ46880.1 glycosyl transferase [Polaribacter reichenbachii]AUC17523.1 glycosyl transferase [Polaribacter reichenbachii]OBY61603.1 glycosyl transferase [Polaribacter reichenbachii]